ncbi:MAG: hypothetical protein IGS03_06525 [Candidatus Sericytochromatia bacterium]|nr:hypothetical protein [Candidatus Sericytochromatia bacterium]
MDELELLIDLHQAASRQGGPGDAEQTRLALMLLQLNKQAPPLQIADISCGTGAAALMLAAELSWAHIRAVDLWPAFLTELQCRASAAGLSEHIETLNPSLERYGYSEAAQALVAAEQREIILYHQYAAYYSYGFYLARKVS